MADYSGSDICSIWCGKCGNTHWNMDPCGDIDLKALKKMKKDRKRRDVEDAKQFLPIAEKKVARLSSELERAEKDLARYKKIAGGS